jgi:hypothetical protein
VSEAYILIAVLYAIGAWSVMQFVVEDDKGQPLPTKYHFLFALLWPITVPAFFLLSDRID